MKDKVDGLKEFIEYIANDDNQELRARVVEFLFEITNKFEF